MRSIMLVVIGLVLGAVAATTVGNVLHMRNAYPRAVMTVMRHHMGALQGALKRQQCPAGATRMHLQRLSSVSNEILPAFSGPDGDIDPHFKADAEHLQEAFRQALGTAPESCANLASSMQKIGDTCDSCHRQFR